MPDPCLEATIIPDLTGLARLLAKRRRALGASRQAIETRAGLAQGHLAKIERGAKGLGPVSLPSVLKALGVRLEVRLVPIGTGALSGRLVDG